MRKTLLLVFIHGFKGDDDTFATFPKHLAALVGHALPNLDVVPLIYPKFETRGDLKETVARFREWLQDKVIDIEVAHNTPSPTVDPSVHTILVGHSMGGIVAAETYLLLASEQPVPAPSSAMNPETPNFPSNTTLSNTTGASHPNPPSTTATHRPTAQMFPYIRGIVAFDTPYLGLAPSMIASQVEGGTQMASTAYKTYNEAAKIFGWGSPNAAAAAPNSAKALPAPATSPLEDAAAAPKWQSWGKVAMFAGAAGAVAAGGAAALYSQRERIGAGWTWASSHLLFIGDLARAEHLKRRVDMLEKATQERGATCANLYTNLGKGKREGTVTGEGGKRTFCNLPSKATGKNQDSEGGASNGGMLWKEAVNDKAKDEISAHCSMFTPRDNPGFYALGEKAKTRIVDSVDQTWYASSEKKPDSPSRADDEGSVQLGDGEAWEKPETTDQTEAPPIDRDEERWEGLDDVTEEDEVRMTESYEGLRKKAKAQVGDSEDQHREADLLMDGGADEKEELEDSVIVDKAQRKTGDGDGGAVPLADENPWARS